jgi:pimeloyl-ACP methyl ester carboxylesterase
MLAWNRGAAPTPQFTPNFSPMTAQEPHPKTIDGSGLALRLWDHGGSGSKVLFLHGFLDTGRSFDLVVQKLPSPLHALCLDWRGHGQSDWAPAGGSYHQLDHLKDLLQVVDALQPEIIVAHSLGGIVGFLHAATSAGQVPQYLFLDACGGFPTEPKKQAQAWVNLVETERRGKPAFRNFADQEAAVKRIMFNNVGLSLAGAKYMVRHATEPAPEGGFRFRFDGRLRGPNPNRFPEATWEEFATRIRARVHVMLGETGIIDRVPQLSQRIEKISGASWEVVAGVGHHLHLDASERVAQQIVTMLATA